MDGYSWTGPAGFIADTQCITISFPGEYCLETVLNDIPSTDRCCRVLAVSPPPPCNITGGGDYSGDGGGTDTICEGESKQWCGPLGMDSYSWTGPNGFTADTECVSVSVAGLYCLETTLEGCVSTDKCCRTLVVRQPPPCTITGGSSDICQGGSTTWCGPEGMDGYTWAGPGGFVADTRCITISTPGEYCLVISLEGCVSTGNCCRTLSVTPPPPCAITGGSDAICQGGSTTWCGPEGMDGYTWTGPNNFVADTRCITISVPGEYCLVTISNDCPSVDNCCRTLTLTPPPPCTISGGGDFTSGGGASDTICQGGSIQWCGPPGMDSYAWTGPNGFTADTMCITVSAPGQYCLVTTLSGCTSTDICCRTLIVNPPPPCTISGGLNTICEDASTQWCGPEGMDAYGWTGPNGFTADTRCISVSVPGLYCLVTVKNDCISTDQCCRTLTVEPCGIECRVTGGGNNESGNPNNPNTYTFGGQAGSPTAAQPQPYGEWTHTQHKGPLGKFTFHAGTASAPAQTRIVKITCSDPGFCHPARPAPARKIDFEGIGSVKNLHKAPPGCNMRRGSLHWFSVHIEDLGEPGSHAAGPQCPAGGFGSNPGLCSCPDFYRIRIHCTTNPNSAVVYEVFGYPKGGNLQIHPPVGSGSREFAPDFDYESYPLMNPAGSCGVFGSVALMPFMLLGLGLMRRRGRRPGA